jgi:hypothetical protein
MQPPGGKRSYEQLTVEILQRLQSGGVLTDVNPGSAMRTLVEAFARQLAQSYAQLALIYEMGFIDTATGDALDHLVALLGQERYTGKQAVGEATFQRDPRVAGQVTIPMGTSLQVVLTRLPAKPVQYKTRRDGSLAVGQSTVTVEIYADLLPEMSPDSVLLGVGDLPVAVTPAAQLAGVSGVAINQPTTMRGQTESDEDLRARVKGLIVAVGGGTAKALEQAALSTGLAKAIALRDAQDALPTDGRPLKPGELEVVVDTTSGQHPDLRQALVGAKGPGIFLRLRDIDQWPVTISVTIRLAGTPSRDQRESISRTAEQTLRQAVEVLQPGETLRWNPIMAALLRLDGVADVLTASVTQTETSDVTMLVVNGATAHAEYPDALPKYTRLVPAGNGRPAVVQLEGERTVYIGVRFDPLPKTLLTQLKLDASQLTGAIADQLEAYLMGLNQTMAQVVKGALDKSQLPKLVPKELQSTVYSVFGSYGSLAPVTSFHITYWDSMNGAKPELLVSDDPVGFSAAQVLRPSPDGVIVAKWE